MTVSSPTCSACGAVNQRNYVKCAKCGARRVVDLSGRTTAAPPKTATTTAATPGGGPGILWKGARGSAALPGQRAGSALGAGGLAGSAGSATTEHEVTRYLCCAVQLDGSLAAQAVAQIVEEPRRAVASSPGVDLACVLAYAIDARSRQLGRDVVLAVLAVLVLFSVTSNLQLTVLWLLIAWAVVSGDLFLAYYRVIVPRLTRESFEPGAAPKPESPARRARLKAIAEQDSGNMTVFQAHAPFSGFGKPVETWSFAVRADVAMAEADEVLPIDVHELYAHVGAEVARLELPGVRVGDRLFVNGDDLLFGLDAGIGDQLLPDSDRPPAAEASAELIRELREHSPGRARAYLALQVTGWGGELVSTLFLRFALLPHGDVLFVEGSTSLLAPVRERYRSVDTVLDQPTFEQCRAIVMQSLPKMPGLLIRSVFAVSSAAIGPLRRYRKDRHEIRAIKHRSFNYGAPMSIREAAGDHQYHRYFQQIDREMYTKVVERRVLDALVEYLEAHGIDTSDLRDRQTSINNTGIFVGENSSLSISDSAIGIGRKAIGKILQKTASAATGDK